MTHDHNLAEMLDLDADVLQDYYREVVTWAGSLTGDRPRVVDLGAGTGTGTLALARHLPGARVTAVDMDEQMLAHLRRRAADEGLTDRIDTIQADLDAGWPDLGPADLIWASASMHHMADPVGTLTRAYRTLHPGGAIMIAELDGLPRFLTDPAGTALEDRCATEMAHRRHEHGLHMHEDWAAALTAAGFTVEAHRAFDLQLAPPLPANARRYARTTFERMRHGLADRLSPADLEALDTLASTALDRDDLAMRTTREVWTARRPA